MGRALWTVACAVAVCGLFACGDKKPAESAEPSAPGRTGPSEDLVALLAAVPAETAGLVVVDAPISAWQGGGEALFLAPERAQAMRQELEEYLKRELGIDPLEARAFVAFGGLGPSGPMFGILARPVSGSLASDRILLAPDLTAEASLSGGTLAIGLPGTAELVAATLAGKRSVASAWAWLQPWLDSERRTFAAAVDFAGIPALVASQLPKGFERATVSVGGGRVVASLRGDQATLERLRGELMTNLDAQIAEAEALKQQATAPGEPPGLGVARIMSYHMTAGSKDRLPPVKNGEVTLDLSLGESTPMFMMATVGVLTALAVPAFMKYTARSKTTEARASLRTIQSAALAHAAEKGRFPASAPLTPARPCGADACAPAPAAWQHPTWQALGFSVNTPHFYAYQFVNDGDKFTARAVGDLDGDGILSTFEIYGAIAAGTGEPVGDPSVATENELE